MATNEDKKVELKDKRYPSPEIAEARIKQALLRYRIAVERNAPATEKEKVRL